DDQMLDRDAPFHVAHLATNDVLPLGRPALADGTRIAAEGAVSKIPVVSEGVAVPIRRVAVKFTAAPGTTRSALEVRSSVGARLAGKRPVLTTTSIHALAPDAPRAIGVMWTPAGTSENVRPTTNAASTRPSGVPGVVSSN